MIIPPFKRGLGYIGPTTIVGPTARRTLTLPDANFTVAARNLANTFTQDQTIIGRLATQTAHFEQPAAGGLHTVDIQQCAGQGAGALLRFLDTGGNELSKFDGSGNFTVGLDKQISFKATGLGGGDVCRIGDSHYTIVGGPVGLGIVAPTGAGLYLAGNSIFKQVWLDNTGIHVGDAGQQIAFFGHATGPQSAAYTLSNVTVRRTLDANSFTVEQLADLVCTLIADLQTLGLVG